MLHFKSFSLFLLLALLSGCVAPAPSATPTTSSTPVPTITPTPTETATLAPKPPWQQTIESQDPQDKFFQIVDGKPVINLYDTQTTESIILNQESVKKTATTDGLNPNILTAQDTDGNKYAFNPDFGWFKVPEVQTNYADLTKYTEVEQSFIEDGRANIVTALSYAENPTISPNAVAPQYWANYGISNNPANSGYIYLSYRPSQELGLAQKKWPDLLAKSYFNLENKPFAWTGFYKVHLKAGETIYVIGRTLKTDNNQVINLFYGFDQKVYENMATNILGDGKTPELKFVFDDTNSGGHDLVAILSPPQVDNNGNPLLWNPDKVHGLNEPNPNVAELQIRNKIMSLFGENDQKNMLDILSQTQTEIQPGGIKYPLWIIPLDSLPKELSKYILLSASN